MEAPGGSRRLGSAWSALGSGAVDPFDACARAVRGISRGLRGQPDEAPSPSFRSEARVSYRGGRGQVNRETLWIFGCPADPVYIRPETDVDAQGALRGSRRPAS